MTRKMDGPLQGRRVSTNSCLFSHSPIPLFPHSPIPRYSDLLSQLPDAVKSDRYCSKLLELLSDHAHYSTTVGPKKWSKKRLINILSTLRPWELQSPETAASIEVASRSICMSEPAHHMPVVG